MSIASAARPPRPPKPPFGRWLLDQAERPDNIGDLARYALADRAYPRSAPDPEMVYDHLVASDADMATHVALEAAEIDWYAY